MKRPGKIPATKQSAAKPNMAPERKSIGLRRSGDNGAARAAQKGDAESFDETGGGKGRGKRKQGAHCRHEKLQAPGWKLRAQKDCLKDQPLGNEAIERWQCRDGHTADQKRECRLRHAMNETAKMLHVALAGCGEHGARAKE